MKSDFVIITALKEEFDAFLNVAKDFAACKIVEPKGDDSVYQIEISRDGRSLLAFGTWQTHIGQVSTAALATKLINAFHPRYIVLLGICAGFEKERVMKGDILVASETINYLDGKVHDGRFVPGGHGIPLDESLRRLFLDHKDEVIGSLAQVYPLPRPKEHPLTAHLAPVVTGDWVVSDPGVMDTVHSWAPRGTAGLEMEGDGLFRAARMHTEGSVRPILIKSACDYGDLFKNDEYRQVAACYSAHFFLRFALKYLCPQIHRAPEVEVVSLSQLRSARDSERLVSAIAHCHRGSTIRLISISGRGVLAPPDPTFSQKEDPHPVKTALKQALKDRKCNLEAILLDPSSEEARARMGFESPQKTLTEAMLWRHSHEVAIKLNDPAAWGPYFGHQFKVKYSQIGLSFGLWLFDHSARIEPYHFGKAPDKRSEPESALCSFSHLWVSPDAAEYELLKDHFAKLWTACTKVEIDRHAGDSHDDVK